MTIETENGWTFAESTKELFRGYMEDATGHPVTGRQAEQMLHNLAAFVGRKATESGLLEAVIRNRQAHEDLAVAMRNWRERENLSVTLAGFVL